jgi:hypothetical protein
MGYAQAGVNAGKIANINGAFGGAGSTAGSMLGGAAGALGMINGVKQGGVLGYGGAAVGGLQMAGAAESLMGNAGAAGALGAAAGYVAAPLAVYSAIKNWQSGSTGSDALQGAEAGAAIGTMIVPGIGTVIGGVIGGAVGALSSAFGGGKSSAEATNAQRVDATLAGANVSQRAAAIATMPPAQAFQMVNGYMNAHDSSPGHSEPIQQVFGKNGVSNMFQQMMPAINSAVAKNPALKGASASTLYSKVVVPWLKSKGATINPAQRDVKGNPEGQNLIDAVTGVIGAWQSHAVTSKTSLGIAGQSMNIPLYGG